MSSEFTAEDIGNDPILKYFNYGHLAAPLAAVSKIFADAAAQVIVRCARSPERTVALRKLLEAKDAAVRSVLP